MPTAKSQTLSLGLHAALVAPLLFLTSQPMRQSPPALPVVLLTPLSRLILPRPAQPRAGGSNRTALPAKRGTPPPVAHRTFVPPTSQPHPPLPMPITVAFDTIAIHSTDIGDPFSRLGDGALGLHGIDGIGDRGCCQGIGESPTGTPGAGIARGRNVTPPQLIDKVEPEFSEEARKAKYQGVVVLAIEVDANGQVRNPRVIQRLGLGLDERAIEAVLRWHFRPGYRDGKPVVKEGTVQVTFQLL